jgi:hypothetical protein
VEVLLKDGKTITLYDLNEIQNRQSVQGVNKDLAEYIMSKLT